MPRFFFKTSVLSLLGDVEDNLPFQVIEASGACPQEFMDIPGVETLEGEFTINEDFVVNAEFWLVNEPGRDDLGEILAGSDAILVFVDPNLDNVASLLESTLDRVEANVKFLPTIVIAVDPSSPITAFPMDLAEQIWSRRVCEFSCLNVSHLQSIQELLVVLFSAVSEHPDAGPVDFRTAWLRESVLWRVMRQHVTGDVSNEDMVYLGRNFYVLHLIYTMRHFTELGENAGGNTGVAPRLLGQPFLQVGKSVNILLVGTGARKPEAGQGHGKVVFQSRLLGMIAARWFERAKEHLVGSKIAWAVGERRYARFLERKYLRALLDEAIALQRAQRYKDAAKKFEEAAYWNRARTIDLHLEITSIKQAIEAWISAFALDRVIDLLEQVPEAPAYLVSLKEKFHLGLDFLLKRGMVERADKQLEYITRIYQKHDLHEIVSEFMERHLNVRLQILERKIADRFIGDAMLALERLVSLRDVSGSDFEIPDSLVATLCVHLIEEGSFNDYENIFPYLKDPETRKQIATRRSLKEEELEARKREEQVRFKKSIHARLCAYADEEREDAIRYAKARRKSIFELVDQGKEDQALHFLDINARWLMDVNQADIAADLAVQTVLHMVRNEARVPLSRVKPFLDGERFITLGEEIARLIEDAAGLEREDVSFSGFVEFYYRQARKHDLYDVADKLQVILVNLLGKECMTLSKDLDDDKLRSIEERLEKINFHQSTADLEGKINVPLDEIHERVVRYFLHENDLDGARARVELISDVDVKTGLYKEIDKRVDEMERERVMSHKLKEQARFLLEDIQELKRVLLLQKHSLPRRRDERLEAIATLSNKHDLPSRLLPFTGEIDVIVQQVDPFLANQEKLLDVLIHERLHDEIALTILSIQLLLLHQGKKEAAASKIRDFAEGGMLTKDKVMEKPAFQLSKTINKAVDLGLGNHLADAVLVSNLLPFVGGERYLPYIVTGRPVPGFLKEEVDVEVNLKITARETLAGSKFPLDAPGMETLTRDGVRGVTIAGHARAGVSPRGAGIRKNQDRITELENTISEVLPYMIEMVSMELEPLKESLLMRRKILASHGEIGALASLKNQNWTTASYSYQEDAHEYFDKGDVELGWTSLWLALLSLLKGGTRVADIASMFDEIKKKRSEDDGFQNHVLLNVFEMLITCLEHEMTNHARELLPLHDLMPLLEEEREILDYSSLIGH